MTDVGASEAVASAGAIGRDEIDSLATLARLSLPDDERDTFARQLGTIVSYLEQLQGVELEGVPEYVAPLPDAAPLRDDVASAPIERAAILAGVSATRDDLVIVPRFVEG